MPRHRNALRAIGPVSGRTAPNAAARPRYDEVYGIYRGLYGALRESMHKLAAVA